MPMPIVDDERRRDRPQPPSAQVVAVGRLCLCVARRQDRFLCRSSSTMHAGIASSSLRELGAVALATNVIVFMKGDTKLMLYKVLYHEEAVEDIAKLPRRLKERILRAIETRLVQSPETLGKPLRYSLKGLWSLRVGDYRIVYRVQGKEVLVLKVGHRKEVYEEH